MAHTLIPVLITTIKRSLVDSSPFFSRFLGCFSLLASDPDANLDTLAQVRPAPVRTDDPPDYKAGRESKPYWVKEANVKRWRRIEVTAFRYRATVVSGEKLSSETHSSPAQELASIPRYTCLNALRL